MRIKLTNPLKLMVQAYIKAGRPLPVNPFKRKVTIVYTSWWLYGTYAFTFKVGERDLKAKLIEHMVANMPESTAEDYAEARIHPMINIEDVF